SRQRAYLFSLAKNLDRYHGFWVCGGEIFDVCKADCIDDRKRNPRSTKRLFGCYWNCIGSNRSAGFAAGIYKIQEGKKANRFRRIQQFGSADCPCYLLHCFGSSAADLVSG